MIGAWLTTSAEQDGLHLEVSLVPALVSALAMVSAIVWLVVAPRRSLTREPSSSRWVGVALLVLGPLTLVAFVVELLIQHVGAFVVSRDQDAAVWRLLPEVLALEVAVGVIAGMLVGAGLTRFPQRRWHQALAPLMLLPALLGPAHGLAVAWQDSPPSLKHDALPWVHAGQTLTLEIEQVPSRAWTINPVAPITPSAAGDLSIELRAESWFASARRDVKLRVREERGPAALPLGVGNRWRYRVLEGSGVFSDLELSVDDTRVERGRRYFHLSATKIHPKAGRSTSHAWVAGVDGLLWVEDSRAQLPAIGKDERKLVGPEPFEVPLLGKCRAAAEPAGGLELVGPCICRTQYRGVGLGDIFILGPKGETQTTAYYLVSSQRAPAGNAQASTAPRWASEACEQPPAEATAPPRR